MDLSVNTLHPVVAALRERLRTLDVQRDLLASRARELEAALADTSREAQRLASEAVQIQALLDLYERDGRGEPAAPTAVVWTAVGPPTARAVSKAHRDHAAIEATADAGADARSDQSASGQDASAPTSRTAAPRRATVNWAAAWRDAAIGALREQGGPLHYRELCRILAGRGFVFGGKSPEATFLASLHRDRTTFQSAGRGTYWLVEAPDGESPAVAGRARRRTSRPRPIGRAKAGA